MIVSHMSLTTCQHCQFLKLIPRCHGSCKPAFTMTPVLARMPFKTVCRLKKDSLSLGKYQRLFITAPMVHWPEVLMTYDQTDKALFSADAFGKFGANDVQEPWLDEARRYYIGIVGKYGQQALLS